MKNQYNLGLSGEQTAEMYLCQQGMSVIARRYRGGDGEIDRVMEDGDVIVFVEVKSRPDSQRGSGLLAVTPAKQRRMSHAALSFLIEREWMERAVRFDVVEISKDGMIHIPNAFMTRD